MIHLHIHNHNSTIVIHQTDSENDSEKEQSSFVFMLKFMTAGPALMKWVEQQCGAGGVSMLHDLHACFNKMTLKISQTASGV